MQSIRRAIRRGNAIMITNKLGTKMEQRPKRKSFEKWSKRYDRDILAEQQYELSITDPVTRKDISERLVEEHNGIINKLPKVA
jgi:hypothetical protein